MNNIEKEIWRIEKEFARKVKQEGMKQAFLYFAAPDAVISRNDRIFKGREEIEAYFDSMTLKNIQLQWEPDLVSVSASEDMAYTYGRYTFSALTPSGEALKSEGIFHTVWKKQKSGEWKYVWD